MYRSKEDYDLLNSMHILIHELEQAIAHGEYLNNEIVLALNGLKLAEENTQKEIDEILKNMLQEAEKDGKLDS